MALRFATTEQLLSCVAIGARLRLLRNMPGKPGDEYPSLERLLIGDWSDLRDHEARTNAFIRSAALFQPSSSSLAVSREEMNTSLQRFRATEAGRANALVVAIDTCLNVNATPGDPIDLLHSIFLRWAGRLGTGYEFVYSRSVIEMITFFDEALQCVLWMQFDMTERHKLVMWSRTLLSS